MIRDAFFSPCRRYRYALLRTWDATLPCDAWVLANPSIADGRTDDATVRRVVGFSQRFGAGSAVVINSCAYIATDPRKLETARRAGLDVRGPENLRIFAALHASDALGRVILGWGDLIHPDDRRWALAALGGLPLWCLGVTRAGEPRHPVRLPYATALERWPRATQAV